MDLGRRRGRNLQDRIVAQGVGVVQLEHSYLESLAPDADVHQRVELLSVDKPSGGVATIEGRPSNPLASGVNSHRFGRLASWEWA